MICLGERSAETVRIYFEKAKDPVIRAALPQKTKTLEEALADYEKTRLPGATSFGRTILSDGAYVGDIWCYCLDPLGEPNAMLSFCVFEKALWGEGIGTEAARLFLSEIRERFGLGTVGAFTYSNNMASARVLEKCGFDLIKEFTEDGRKSRYYQLTMSGAVPAGER